MSGTPAAASALIDVPGYEVLERIGAGGFGEVFRARHRVIDREVAIKVIHERHSHDAAAIARFVAEARAVNKISHPNIVEISDFGELPDGRPYCVMELIRGHTLRAILASDTRLPLVTALPILRGVAEAVDAAHAAGIAHRDLKPDNVFVTSDGSIKLIDFGIAKLTTDEVSVTQTGQVFGTPLYMSPEQCRGKSITLATDAYSLGALAYHVLTGSPPFSGEPLELALQHINEAPLAPTKRLAELPPHVDGPILALLAKDPAVRPTRMLDAIEALAGDRVLPAPRRQTWRVFGLLGAGILCVAGGATWLATRSSDPPAAKPPWPQQMLRLDLDGIIDNPAVSRDAARLIYGDESGWWRHDFASGKTSRISLPFEGRRAVQIVEELPDGRLLVGVTNPLGTELVDPRDRSHTRVFDGGLPALSPDRTQIAAWDAGGFLVVHDLGSHQTRRLAQLTVPPSSPPLWSPDGTQLLWGRGGPPPKGVVLATRVSDGATLPLRGPLAVDFRNTTTEDYYSPIAFLPDGRIAYCTSRPARVVARPLWGGELETLATLDETVSDCQMATRGHGLLVTLGRSLSTIGMLDVRRAEDKPASFVQLAGPQGLLPTVADERQIHAYPLNQGGVDVTALDFDGGGMRTTRRCPGEVFMVRRGSELLHVVIVVNGQRRTMRLITGESCHVVEEWQLGEAIAVSMPRCHGSSCTTVTTHRDHATIWTLDHGAPPAERARIPFDGMDPEPAIAISIDGKQIAIAATGTERTAIYVFDRAQGEPRRIPLTAYLLDGVTWTASGKLLVSGQNIDEAPYALVEIAEDGTHRVLWTSKSTYLTTLMSDPTGRYVFGRIATWRQEFLLLDPPD